MTYSLILTVIIAVAIFGLIIGFVKRYKRCPSDKLLVIYGKTGKKNDGETQSAKVYHGGGAFVWPIIQDYEFLDLKPISLEVGLKNALSKQNIRIDVPATFTVAISSEKGTSNNAAERLLGLDRRNIAELAKDIIFGQLRLVIATMNIEEINSDRDKFLAKIQDNLESELTKIGLKLINVNITDINDESGFIDALGKEAAAAAINEAKVSVADKNREGAIGVAKADQDKRINVAEQNQLAEIGEAEADKKRRVKVADANSVADIGEADAEQKRRVSVATANATAIAGENSSASNIAETTAQRKVAEAEANRIALTAENVKRAQANRETYEAQTEAEKKRAEKEKALQYANIVVPAEIEKSKKVIAAEAEAERIRTIANGEADATYAKMSAEAKGIEEILTKRAEGFERLVEAAGSAEQAAQLMVADNLEALIKTQVEAIKNIKIDKITVWDQGSGSNGEGGSTSNFMKDLFKMVPPLKDVFNQVGSELPAFIQGAEAKAKGAVNGKASAIQEIADAKVVKDDSTEA